MALNPLVLSTREEQEDADDLYLSLTQLAKPTTRKQGQSVIENIENVMRERQQVAPPVPDANPPKKRRSRFFYSPTKSLTQFVDESKTISEPRSIEHENDETLARVDQYAKELPEELKGRIQEIREYLLKEWLPVALATGAATTQTVDVAQRTLGTPLDPGPLSQFERMMDKALTIKMAEFVAQYTDMPKDRAQELVDHVAPQPQQVMVIGPHDDQVRARHDHQRRGRKEKDSEES